jgi:hypothetical protein
MSTLVDEILDAYGGAARWRDVETISASKRFGGAIWGIKSVAGVVEDGEATVWIQQQHTSLRPFTAPNLESDYTPDRVRIQTTVGETIEQLDDPRASFTGHTLQTPWTTLQLAYFTGYAMWTYTAEPLNLTLPGVTVREGETWIENGEVFRRLHVLYPPHIATHSTSQVLYVDAAGLIRRRDYEVDIAGESPGAHYVSEFETVDDIVIPAKRMIYVRDEAGNPMLDQLVVSIELSDIRVA